MSPYFFDVNNNRYLKLPLNSSGLVHDECMEYLIKFEKGSKKISLEEYMKASKIKSFHIILMNLIGNCDICDKLEEYNADKLKELEKKTYERLRVSRNRK